MDKDYKITTTVNKEAYLKLRGRLMLKGISFNVWLDKKIGEELGFVLKHTSRKTHILENPKTGEVLGEDVAGKQEISPIEKSADTLTKERGEMNAGDYI